MNTALQMTSVVDVTLMNTLAPIVVGALAIPLFDERPGTRFRLWSAMAFVGAALVVIAGSSGPEGDPVGMVIAALNVVFYSLYFVASKRARVHIDTIPFLLAANGIAALLVSGWVVLMQNPVGTISGHDLFLCLAVATVPGVMGHFSVTWAVRWVPANLPPVLMLSIPFQVVGGFITLAGVAGAVFAAGTSTPVEALAGAEET
jgi:drug/metabolite transporter (DMT)-like permease